MERPLAWWLIFNHVADSSSSQDAAEALADELYSLLNSSKCLTAKARKLS